MRGAIMKKILVTALVLGSVCAGPAAYAASSDDVLARLAALEKENAAIRKENAALRENKVLRQQNASLKSSSAPVQAATESGTKSDPFGAFAADMPMAYKARLVVGPTQLRVWGEGGALFSGGDPIYSFFDRPAEIGLGSYVDNFALTPKVGWEAATGFDYRFADSPWHVSAQFRYGDGRKSVANAFSFSVPPDFTVAVKPDAGIKETHWLADIAMGRDVIGTGAAAMQVKFGLRIAELRSSTNAANPEFLTLSGNFLQATVNENQESKFFGAGPRAGLEGSVPLGRGWAFDYLGDASVLFGTQNFQISRFLTNYATSIPGTTIPPFTFTSTQTFSTVFNADVQVGVSYWVMSNVKVSASYRLDAYFNALNGLSIANDTAKQQTGDRYIHGPHLGVSATF
jgi:hypothetical protein